LRYASVGVRRLVARLRPVQGPRSAAAVTFQRRTISIARAIRAGSRSRPALAGERLVSVTAVGLVAVALVLSNLGSTAIAGPIGNTQGAGSEPRLAVGGAVAGIENAPLGAIDDRIAAADPALGGGDLSATALPIAPDDRVSIDGPFSADGTLVKPVSVDTAVADGANLIRSYRVQKGDTLTGIAAKFNVSMMTVWWANQLKAKDELHVGQALTIPPVNGVVVTVAPTDTLLILAAKFSVDPAGIIAVNQLPDTNLIAGQTLTIPGARLADIPTPSPTAAPTRKPVSTSTSSSRASSGGTTRPPAAYSGGKLGWPVPGGFISQYFHYGHGGLDIAADAGTRVTAAAAGVVLFAGWKNNGGGYQVWISHGSNLYTTYNHMMSVSVGRGQVVSRGQQVGRVGMTGDATGPHCHFEVWLGMIWGGGTRVNPLGYL